MPYDLQIDTDELRAARLLLTDAAQALAAGSDPAALAAPSSAAGSAPIAIEALRAVLTWTAHMVESQDRCAGEAAAVADALARAIRIFEDTG